MSDGQREVHPAWFDGSEPSSQTATLGALIRQATVTHASKVLVALEDGSEWTGQGAFNASLRLAAGLQALGVKRGEHLVCWLPNGPDHVLTLFAAALLGAVNVPVNLGYRGSLLAHVLRLTQARVAVVHPDLLPRLGDVPREHLRHVVVAATHAPPLEGSVVHLLKDLAVLWGSMPPPAVDCRVWETAAVVFTSGTTGPSKGVLCPAGQLYTTGKVVYGFMTQQDRMLVNLPLFRVGALTAVYGALTQGASLAFSPGFRAATFWQEIARTGATIVPGLIGSMVDLLLREPERPEDARTPLRAAVIVGAIGPTVRQFASRFGVQCYTGFNMTEISTPLISEFDPQIDGSCGRVRNGMECRVVDEHDQEVPHGITGELIVRAERPWTLNVGYLADASATLAAWRNGWFHTGDVFRRDRDDNFYFVDRLKDAIRRRGENISSVEVEREALQFPGLDDAAVVGVRAGRDDEEILLAVQPLDEGPGIDPRQLHDFLLPRLPHFMVPRFIRVMAALPRTPTNKVRKVELREMGVTADTWDRQEAGIVVRAEKLGAPGSALA